MVTLVDTLAEGDQYVRYDYQGYRADLGLHVISVGFYEGGTFLVLHDATGEESRLPGDPLMSPDRRRFVASSWDLEAGYDANVLEIWRVDSTGLAREYELDGGTDWGPDSVSWVGNDSVRFRRLERDRASPVHVDAIGWVIRRAGQWMVEGVAP